MRYGVKGDERRRRVMSSRVPKRTTNIQEKDAGMGNVLLQTIPAAKAVVTGRKEAYTQVDCLGRKGVLGD